MELHFKLTQTNDGKIMVETRDGTPNGGFGPTWSHFGTYDDLEKAAKECGGEVAYQYREELEEAETDDPAPDNLARLLHEPQVVVLDEADRVIHVSKDIRVEVRAESELIYSYYHSPVRQCQLVRDHNTIEVVNTDMGIRLSQYDQRDRLLSALRQAIVEDGLADFIGVNGTFVRVGRFLLSPGINVIFHIEEDAKRETGEIQ